MKKVMLALLAAGSVLILAGCCCDKAEKGCDKPARKMCHRKHHHAPKACAPAECPKPTPAPPPQQPQTATATETVVVEAVGK